ncbi:MAG: type II secretion system protein [Cyanobacteria bacterium SIG30]|nr:type II secretion system protein [Cyanobacteria bacterium SIG30]
MNKNIKNAFTLAEVLITLAIIGVVAALTIPTLITNYQQQEWVVQFKKNYSIINRITNLAIMDYGSMAGWALGEVDNGADAVRYVQTYMAPYLRIAKDCEDSTEGDCGYTTRGLNGTPSMPIDGRFAKLYLADGSLLGFRIYDNTSTRKRVLIVFDSNGQKKPNIYGKDIFYMLHVIAFDNRTDARGKLVSAGGGGAIDSVNDSNSACKKSGRGYYCGHVIMQNSWKIPSKEEYVRLGGSIEEYPW